MSTVESHGFPNTGRLGTSASLSAERENAARSELVLSESVLNGREWYENANSHSIRRSGASRASRIADKNCAASAP